MKPILPWANERKELRSYGDSSMLKQNDVSQAAAVLTCLVFDWCSQSPETSSQMLKRWEGECRDWTQLMLLPPKADFLFPPHFVTLIFN